MASRTSLLVQQILVFAFLGLIGWLIYVLISYTFNFFETLNPSVVAAIIAGSATIIVSVLSVLVTKFFEQRYTVIQQIREKKIPIYEKIIQFVFRIVKGVKSNEPVSDTEMANFMLEFTEDLIVWGSDEVVAAFYQFRNSGDVGDGRKVALAIEALLFAIRKDLGHKNKNLSEGKLLGLFITDFQQYMLRDSSQEDCQA